MATNSEPDDSIVETVLTCRICRFLFDDNERRPKILGCMHTICDYCIQELMKDTPIVLCPFCKNSWKVPPDGFPDNTMVMSKMQKSDKAVTPTKVVTCENCDGDTPNDAEGYCNDCAMAVCGTCIDHHKLLAVSRDHHIDKPVPNIVRRRSKSSRCRRHMSEFLTVFCSTCQMTTCNTCFITGHHGHKCTDLQRAVDEKKAKLMALADDCSTRAKPINALLSTIQDITETFKDICGQREKEIDEFFTKLEEQIAEQREKAKEELRQLCKVKTNILKDQEDEVNTMCVEYQSASEFAEHLCQLSEPEQLLGLQQQVTDRLNDLIKRENTDTILQGPLINTAMAFSKDHTKAAEDLQKTLQQMGRIDTSTTIPALCYATRQDLRGLDLINNLPKKLKIHAVSFDGKLKNNEEGGDVFTATLVSPGDKRADCRVEDHGDGTYTMHYTPMISGRHSLHVHIAGQPIAGSPFQFKSQPMKYQPVNIKPKKSGVTWEDPPIVGVPHCININVISEHEEGEPEAKVKIITADIRTDEDEAIPYKITRTENGTRVTYTPPKIGNLHVSIKNNDQPMREPFQIVVTSLERSTLSWQQQQLPVVGQRWLLTVELRNHADQKIKLNSRSVAIVIANAVGYTGVLGTARAITTSEVDSTHKFECVCKAPGTHTVTLQVKGATAKEVTLKTIDRMHFTMSENTDSFPTSVDTSLSGKVFLSDTKLGSIYVRSTEDKALPTLPVGTDNASSQLSSDKQNLYLLIPEQHRVLVITERGGQIAEWACDKDNKIPVTISASRNNNRYQDDLLVIGDATENANALFLYRKDGTLKSSVPLPSGSFVDGIDNVCIDGNDNVWVCHFSAQEIIKIILAGGEQMKTYRTTSRSNQLSITATSEGYLLVSEKGRINVYQMKNEVELQEINTILTDDHIYTSLSATVDGCVVALDVRLKQLTKYGYLHSE